MFFEPLANPLNSPEEQFEFKNPGISITFYSFRDPQIQTSISDESRYRHKVQRGG